MEEKYGLVKRRGLMAQRRGQVLNVVSGTVIGFMILIFTIFAVLYGISVLNPASFFATGSANANATNNLVNNLTDGASQFGARIPTVLIILGAVMALSAIVLLIGYIRRGFGAEQNGGL